MPTPELIDRVAREIGRRLYETELGPLGGAEHKLFCEAAQAALKAHDVWLAEQGLVVVPKEPTETMTREGFERIWNCEVYCRDDPLHMIEMQTTAGKTAWQAMISAALQDSEVQHKSDCAVHNAPAYEPGPCDCGALQDSEKGE